MVRVQLRSLSGQTTFLDSPAHDVDALRDRVAAFEGVPVDELRLTSSGRELRCGSSLDDHAMVTVLLRLEGGKGGFGAMLRTAGARGVKTTNFDACRDLNGRRLRHVNAEAALREWDNQAEERKLKKQQEDARRAAANPQGPPPITRFDDDEYEEMLEGTRGRVDEALAAAMKAAAGGSTDALPEPVAAPAGSVATSSTAAGKRKASEPSTAAAGSKSAKLWADPLAGLGEGESSGEESADDEGNTTTAAA